MLCGCCTHANLTMCMWRHIQLTENWDEEPRHCLFLRGVLWAGSLAWRHKTERFCIPTGCHGRLKDLSNKRKRIKATPYVCFWWENNFTTWCTAYKKWILHNAAHLTKHQFKGSQINSPFLFSHFPLGRLACFTAGIHKMFKHIRRE